MDESMEEEDSLFSIPGASNTRPRALYQTPPQLITTSAGPGVGLGFHTSVVPQHLPEYDESFEQPNRWSGGGQGASPADISSSTTYEYSNQQNQDESREVEEGQDGQEEEGEEEESYEASESSSAQYDPDTDPESFAQRLDQLAGILEIGEEEVKARKWGLPISKKQKKGPDLPLNEFRKLINHHLTSTEWEYNPSIPLNIPVPGRQTMSLPGGLGRDLIGDIGDSHPIRVLGRGWIEQDDWLDINSDDMDVEGRDGL